MERNRLIVDAALALALLTLTGLAWSQHASLGQMEETLALMDARVTAVEATRTKTVAGSEPSEVDGREDGGFEAEVVPVVAALPRPAVQPSQRGVDPPTLDVADPEVRGQLREVIEEEQQIMREERWRQRSQRREERLRAQITELAEKTDMDSTTSEQVTDLLVVEQAEASEIFRQAREDFSWEEAREKVTTLRTETDARAKELLEDDQYAEYQKLREEETSRWGGGGGPARGDRAPTNTARRERSTR